MLNRERLQRAQERMPTFLLRPLPAALEPLETLALDLRWTRSHAGDVVWRRGNPEVGAGPAGAVAAALGVSLVFGLADFFTEEITVIAADVHRVERWLALAGLLALAVVLVISVWRWKRRLGTERRDAERTEGPTPRPWGSRAVGPSKTSYARRRQGMCWGTRKPRLPVRSRYEITWPSLGISLRLLMPLRDFSGQVIL